MKLLLRTLLLPLCLFILSFGSGVWVVVPHDLWFHTDIARDFLILEEMAQSYKPVLIGAKTGGIPGVFHGPLWLYLNLPVFLLGRGNPVAVSWFWCGLTALLVYLCYLVTTKIAHTKYGLIAGLWCALIFIPQTKNLFNPFGAVLLMPVFYYFFLSYLRHNRQKHLTAALFSLGLMVQFQMALAVPLLILTSLLMMVRLFRSRQWKHGLSFLILLLPFSTFILFDLRHDFLQIRSVINYLTGKASVDLVLSFSQIINDRWHGFFNVFQQAGGNTWLGCLVIGLTATGLFYKPLHKIRTEVALFWYLYLGYWLLTLLFKGKVWGYYYAPFIPLVIIIATTIIIRLKLKAALLILMAILMVNTINFFSSIRGTRDFSGDNLGSWQFYRQVAENLFQNEKDNFGFYIFTEDQYGYQMRYAMIYQSKQQKKDAKPYEKAKATYLLLEPEGTNPFISQEGWKKNQVKIDKPPSSIITYSNGYRVEKYELTPEEVAISSDPNLIHDLFFR